LFERFNISVVKIGIVESWEILLNIVTKLHDLNSEIKIIVDPIIKATAGFDFHATENQELLDAIWQKCYLITPNYNEIEWLYPKKDIEETIEHICSKTNIYLKGGHRTDKKGIDELYHNKIVMVNILPNTDSVFDKHGSGCVLSASLAANIFLKIPLEEVVIHSKRYIENFLNSNQSLLGTHTSINKKVS